ncbi:helix-turn-helix domain-containing protein [Nitrosospira sp. Nsp11]|uniref:helix-turn-helix domain-containing protein n=1 Tax=Nitrosospira sp. Nsp11 TaxID=1855338 RepID=UPI000933EA5A
MTRLLTIPQAAERLSISRRTLEREINDGEIAVCRVRGRVLIAESDLNAYISRLRTYTEKTEICPGNVATFGMPAYKSKVGALKSLLDGERRAKTRFS